MSQIETEIVIVFLKRQKFYRTSSKFQGKVTKLQMNAKYKCELVRTFPNFVDE